MRIMSGIFLGLIGLGLLCIGLLGFTGTPRQQMSDQRFKERFTPIISYVETFRSTNDRYPNRIEFEEWKEKNGFKNQAVFLYDSSIPTDSDFTVPIDSNKAYILSMWRGEWNVYYVAQEERFYPGDWDYGDATAQFLFCSILGAFFLFPSSLLIRPQKTKRHKGNFTVNKRM